MIKAKYGVVKVKGYTFTVLQETIGIIDALMRDGNKILGDDIKSKEAMLTTMIKVVECKTEGRSPMDLIGELSKEETKALFLLMKAVSVGESDDDEEEEEDDDAEAEDSSKPKVTVICGGKKVVTDADGIGKIIADMVTDEIKGKEKQ